MEATFKSNSTIKIKDSTVDFNEILLSLNRNIEVAKTLVQKSIEEGNIDHLNQVFEVYNTDEDVFDSYREKHDVLVLAGYYTLRLSRVVELLIDEYNTLKSKDGEDKAKLFLV